MRDLVLRRRLAVALFVLPLLAALPARADHAQHPWNYPEPSACNTFVRFSPHGGAAATVIYMLDLARFSVHIAMYSLTNQDLANALIAAKTRGVDVALKLDRTQSAGASQQAVIAQLQAAGIVVEVSNQTRQLHHKFAVIDGWYVVTGSFNWSLNAENRNRENLLILECADLAQVFEDEWALIQPNAP